MDHVSYRLHIGSSILLSIELKQPTKRIQIKAFINFNQNICKAAQA